MLILFTVSNKNTAYTTIKQAYKYSKLVYRVSQTYVIFSVSIRTNGLSLPYESKYNKRYNNHSIIAFLYKLAVPNPSNITSLA